MNRKLWIGIPILAAILATAVGVALSKKENAEVPNMTGAWIVDASKSDAPPMRGGGEGWRGRGEGRRGWGGRGEGRGEGGGEGRGQSRGRPARLPERIRIQQSDAMVSIADSAGVPLEEILIGTKVETPPEGMEDQKAVPTFGGTWTKGKLEVVRKGRRGSMTQSFSLEEHGRVLVLRTTMDARGDRPSREFKRVYRRTNT